MKVSGKSAREAISHIIFAGCAVIGILLMALILFFIGSRAFQTFTVHHINPISFFTGTRWFPDGGNAGALVLIAGSLVTTLAAVLISVPLSLGIAIFIAEVAPPWARAIMQPVLELFLGIPSIIYGFLGLVLLVPLIANLYNSFFGGYYYSGFGLIAAAIVLSIMILPTITTLSVDAIRTLPVGLREASYALGATRWQTIRKTLLPAASSGIFTGIILGIGRAIGETLAVSYVIGGNANRFPIAIDGVYPYFHLLPTSTITVQMLFDFGEAVNGSLALDAVWTLAFILLVITILLVLASRWIRSHGAYNVRQKQETSTSRWPLLARGKATQGAHING
jgi:phosphate transport system permease protein